VPRIVTDTRAGQKRIAKLLHQRPQADAVQHLEIDLAWFKKEISYHKTVDTLARRLYLINDSQSKEELKKLKVLTNPAKSLKKTSTNPFG
jgi:hypothetical protein